MAPYIFFSLLFYETNLHTPLSAIKLYMVPTLLFDLILKFWISSILLLLLLLLPCFPSSCMSVVLCPSFFLSVFRVSHPSSFFTLKNIYSTLLCNLVWLFALTAVYKTCFVVFYLALTLSLLFSFSPKLYCGYCCCCCLNWPWFWPRLEHYKVPYAFLAVGCMQIFYCWFQFSCRDWTNFIRICVRRMQIRIVLSKVLHIYYTGRQLHAALRFIV